MPPLLLTGRNLTIDGIVEVARGHRNVALAAEAAERMRASRSVIERLVADGTTAYGVTTGFGDLADVRIDPARTGELQRNLVRSHAAGVGEPLADDVVRAMMLLRANALAVGLSGVRVEVVDLLLQQGGDTPVLVDEVVGHPPGQGRRAQGDELRVLLEGAGEAVTCRTVQRRGCRGGRPSTSPIAFGISASLLLRPPGLVALTQRSSRSPGLHGRWRSGPMTLRTLPGGDDGCPESRSPGC